ncbi:MAG: divergent polysaccharide deacetylase family protein [Alphaproteobacteria bacterium]
MRVLLYTATIFFVGVSGLFAFFAVQPSTSGTNAKVVISIDPSTMPTAAASNNARPTNMASAASFGDSNDAEARLGNNEAPSQQAPAEPPSFASPPADSGAKQEVLPLAGTVVNTENENAIINAGTGRSSMSAPSVDERAIATQNLATPDTPEASDTSEDRLTADVDASANEQSASAPAASPDKPMEVASRETPSASMPEAGQQTEQQSGEQQTADKPNDTLASNLAALDEPYNAPHSSDAPASTPPPAPATDATPALAMPDEAEQSEPSTQVATAPDALASPVAPPVVAEKKAAVATLAPPPIPARRPAHVPTIKTAALTTTIETTPNQARVAILIRGIGKNSLDSQVAIDNLPSAISLGFESSDNDVKQWVAKAKERGHEVIVQLPLETSGSGRKVSDETLLTNAEPVQNVARLNTVLERFDTPNGVTNIKGGKLLQSQKALQPILQDIKNRGLMYIAVGRRRHTLFRKMAKKMNLRHGNANLVIDTNPTPGAIKKSLQRLIAIARKNGSAIGIGSVSNVTIEQLQAWSEELSAQGVTLVPVGALALTPGAS